jgi:hypothetical protein
VEEATASAEAAALGAVEAMGLAVDSVGAMLSAGALAGADLRAAREPADWWQRIRRPRSTASRPCTAVDVVRIWE